MKKVKYLPGALLLLLGIGAAVLFIRFFPYIRAAMFLNGNLDLQKMSFDVTVTLSEERLSEKQKAFVKGLSRVTGFGEKDFMTLRLRGSTWEDMIYVQITPEEEPQGERKPLTELYLGKADDVVNARMLYDRVRGQLSGSLGMLGGLLPEWQGGEYVSLAQAEEMFELDLQSAREFELVKYKEWFSFPAYFAIAMLAEYEITEDGAFTFSFEDLPETLDTMLSKTGVNADFSQKRGLYSIRSISGTVWTDEPKQLLMPESLIQQDTVEKIATVRRLLQELLGM